MRVFRASIIVLVLALLAVAFVGLIYGAVVGDVFGLFSYDVIVNFFSGYTGEEVAFGMVVAIFTLVPNFGVAFLSWLKNLFGLSDKQAHDFIFVVSFIISGIALLVTGSLEVAGLEFTLRNLGSTGLVIYGLSQLIYNRILNPEKL